MMQGKIMGIIFAGIIACLAMDIFQRLLLFTFALPLSNWAVVGCWAFHVLVLRGFTNRH